MDDALLCTDVLAGVCRAAWDSGDVATYVRLTHLLSKDTTRCLCAVLHADFREARKCRRQFALVHMCDVARAVSLEEFAAPSMVYCIFSDLRQAPTFEYLVRRADIFYDSAAGIVPLNSVLALCDRFVPTLRVAVVFPAAVVRALEAVFARFGDAVFVCGEDVPVPPERDVVLTCGVAKNSIDLSFEELAYRERGRGETIWINVCTDRPWARLAVLPRFEGPTPLYFRA